jgi:PEGA domain
VSRSTSRVAVIVAFLALIPLTAQAGVKFGGIVIGTSYASGPYFGPYYGYGCFDPFWCGPYGYPWGPMFYTSAPGRPMGEVKLGVNDKKAEVYIDGAFAGLAKDLKHIWLDPGVYQVEVRAAGQEPVERRIYVLTNKTVKLDFSRSAQ